MLFLLLLLAGAALWTSRRAPDTEPATSAPPIAATTPAIAPEPAPVPQIERESLTGTIAAGSTITTLLGDYLTPSEIFLIDRLSRKTFPLSNISAGQPYEILLTANRFDRFEYDINRNEQLIIARNDESFEVSRKPIEFSLVTEVIEGTINSSLFEAIGDIGEAVDFAVNLTDIFAWDIDFIRDIRKGDTFRAIVEKRYRDGKPAGYGRILAAEFTNRGETYKAFWYKDGSRRGDYYDEKGQSLRKAFLKAPLAFTRISSGYSKRRFHPITKTWKAHPAIDYAAPTGTPIKAVGDGTITRARYSKNNGNHVKIRHNGTYETLYLHMSKIAKGIRPGAKVRQGQVIGYVGSTGLATGPHLCFRMYKNGVNINPTKVRSKGVAPISKANLATFKTLATPYFDRLDRAQLLDVQVTQGSENIQSEIAN